MSSKLVYTPIESYVFAYALSKRDIKEHPHLGHFIMKNMYYDSFYKEVQWEIWDIKIPSYQISYTGSLKQSFSYFCLYYSLQFKNIKHTENYAKFNSI